MTRATPNPKLRREPKTDKRGLRAWNAEDEGRSVIEQAEATIKLKRMAPRFDVGPPKPRERAAYVRALLDDVKTLLEEINQPTKVAHARWAGTKKKPRRTYEEHHLDEQGRRVRLAWKLIKRAVSLALVHPPEEEAIVRLAKRLEMVRAPDAETVARWTLIECGLTANEAGTQIETAVSSNSGNEGPSQ